MKKRILSMLIAAVMLLSVMPVVPVAAMTVCNVCDPDWDEAVRHAINDYMVQGGVEMITLTSLDADDYVGGTHLKINNQFYLRISKPLADKLVIGETYEVAVIHSWAYNMVISVRKPDCEICNIIPSTTKTLPNFIAPIKIIQDTSDWIPISNRAELEAINDNLDGKYYLVNDIDLGGKEWTPIGDMKYYRFSGVFDGQGYVIRGLTITEPKTRYNGLFACATATIKNLGMEDTNIDITSSNYLELDEIHAGAIVGSYDNDSDYGGNHDWDRTLTLYNCYNTGKVSANNLFTDEAYAGGLVGLHRFATISYSYNTGDVTSSYFGGGIIGSSSKNINNCYNTGDITVIGKNSEVRAGGIASHTGGNISNCYNSGNVYSNSDGSYGKAISGGIVGVAFNDSNVTDCYNIGIVKAICDYSAFSAGIAGLGIDSDISVSNCYNSGNVLVSSDNISDAIVNLTSDGAVNNCYWNIDKTDDSSSHAIPLTTAQMKQVSSFVGFDFANVWTIIPGVNDGMPVLRGFNYAIPVPSVPSTNNNFIVKVEPIADTSDWTPISNRAELEAIADNLDGKYYLVNDIDLGGEEWVPIQDFGGTLDGQGYVIRNMTIIRGDYSYGGLFGETDSDVMFRNIGLEDIYISFISTSSISVGGIVGHCMGDIDNCYATGKIDVASSNSDYGISVGGISGSISGNITNCYNTAEVRAETQQVWISAGGIVGSINRDDTVRNCYNGGIIVADTNGTEGFAGGIVGYGSGNITNCFNSAYGFVFATDRAGGIVGETGKSAFIDNCYNTADVITWNLAGGIVGDTSSNIKNCYNNGSVRVFTEGNADGAGGIAGTCYGASGDLTISFNYCYYNSDISSAGMGIEQFVRGTTTPLTTTQMQQQSSFTGFDFDNVWTIIPGVNDGMPVLRGFDYGNVNSTLCESCNKSLVLCPDCEKSDCLKSILCLTCSSIERICNCGTWCSYMPCKNPCEGCGRTDNLTSCQCEFCNGCGMLKFDGILIYECTCENPHTCNNKCTCKICECNCINKTCHDCGICTTCKPTRCCMCIWGNAMHGVPCDCMKGLCECDCGLCPSYNNPTICNGLHWTPCKEIPNYSHVCDKWHYVVCFGSNHNIQIPNCCTCMWQHPGPVHWQPCDCMKGLCDCDCGLCPSANRPLSCSTHDCGFCVACLNLHYCYICNKVVTDACTKCGACKKCTACECFIPVPCRNCDSYPCECPTPHTCNDKCTCEICECTCTNKTCHDCGICTTCKPTPKCCECIRGLDIHIEPCDCMKGLCDCECGLCPSYNKNVLIQVTMNHALRILMHLAKIIEFSEQEQILYDLNYDCEITIGDALIVLMSLSNIIDTVYLRTE